MFHYLTGILAEAGEGRAVLDVNGVGYELLISKATLAKLPAVGKPCKLFTFLSVKEDGVTLSGFISSEEKSMFLKLNSISGIGPKGAMAVLSGMELGQLAYAIVSGNVKALSKIKGVGKKTAERIVLELKEKLNAEEVDLPLEADRALDKKKWDRDTEDAVTALRTLGIGQQEAYEVVVKAKPHSKTIEDLIQNALRALGN